MANNRKPQAIEAPSTPTSIIPPTPTPPPTAPASIVDVAAFPEAEEFKEALKELTVEKGPLATEGFRKCYHCRQNKKPTRLFTGSSDTRCIECGCSENKAVCEWLLVRQQILGKAVRNGVELRSLTEAE